MAHRIIFMGTPDFAVPALTKLHRRYQVVGVVTQPDGRSGRGRKVVTSAVKQMAAGANLPLLQPPTLRNPEVVAHLRSLEPDLIVIAAFGQILRANILDMPLYGCINIHASLLPRWRGAAPVAAAIRAGDTQTGITLMQVNEGLDTGPIIASRSIPITARHTRATLTQELANLGADLLIDTLPDWLGGKIRPAIQDDSAATLAPRINKAEGLIDWTQSAAEIERHVRAFDPWPGTFTHWQDKRLKILSITAHSKPGKVAGWPKARPAGRVFMLDKEIAVATGEGAIVLGQIQLAGKRAIQATDFVHGVPGFIGAQF